jgi:hypothetical protein
LRCLIAIARDASAPAALRIAVIRVLAGHAGSVTSDPGWPAQRRKLAADLGSLIRELTPRAPGSLRTELVACAARWKLFGAVPAEHAIAASATQRDRVVTYHVAAAPGVEATLRGVTLLRSDGTACDGERRSARGRPTIGAGGSTLGGATRPRKSGSRSGTAAAIARGLSGLSTKPGALSHAEGLVAIRC